MDGSEPKCCPNGRHITLLGAIPRLCQRRGAGRRCVLPGSSRAMHGSGAGTAPPAGAPPLCAQLVPLPASPRNPSGKWNPTTEQCCDSEEGEWGSTPECMWRRAQLRSLQQPALAAPTPPPGWLPVPQTSARPRTRRTSAAPEKSSAARAPTPPSPSAAKRVSGWGSTAWLGRRACWPQHRRPSTLSVEPGRLCRPPGPASCPGLGSPPGCRAVQGWGHRLRVLRRRHILHQQGRRLEAAEVLRRG